MNEHKTQPEKMNEQFFIGLPTNIANIVITTAYLEMISHFF